jgi:hypothetical protein
MVLPADERASQSGVDPGQREAVVDAANRVMTRRLGFLIVAGTLAVLVVAGVVLWRRGRVDPLPPAVRTAVTNEKADRARVDSQLVAATLEAQAAQRRQDAANARAKAAERRARAIGLQADSLAREAQHASTARDSALFYRLAYTARTSERDTLLVALAGKDTALAEAERRAVALTRSDSINRQARTRADSVLDAVVASVTVCTVPGTFGRVRCPSRKVALAVGIVGGLATEEMYRAVKDGRISIRLPFR